VKHNLVFVLLIFSLCACNLTQKTNQSPRLDSDLCGDGVCSGPENLQNCPQDCTGNKPLSEDPSSQTVIEGTIRPIISQPAHETDAPLFMTTMTHMEGNWNDDVIEMVFLRHVEQLRFAMDLAGEYNALLTIESEKPFARANANWNLNIMAEVRDRGFGVGTHCDIGFNEPRMSIEEFAAMFAENKAAVDALVGVENNLGCSGGGSVNDWALAASMAGFKYLDGIVGMHYLAMPIQNRPSMEWTDEFIRNSHFHLNAPVDLDQRIYLFEVANALDFSPDENSIIVISSGELGLISAMAERGREFGGSEPLHDDEYPFDQSDIDALVGIIREVDRNRDRTRIAKLCTYLPASIYVEENESILRYLFEQMRNLVDEGVISWATQRKVYEAYISWIR
jgi:hypothetical protein